MINPFFLSEPSAPRQIPAPARGTSQPSWRRLISSLTVLLAVQLPAQDTLFITEFLAANTGPLVDEDGESSDWIEIFNAGTNAVNLGGWHLTDDGDFLTKWTFPATNLGAGKFMLVFASGKDRVVGGAELHANFQLDSAGEYLALVRPDGQTIAHHFAPKFPAQVDGVSYGVAINVSSNAFVLAGADVRWTVPADPAGMPVDWATTNFDHNAWFLGQTGLGFAAGAAGSLPPGTATNLAVGKPATQSSTLSSFNAGLAVNGSYSDFTHTAAGQNLPATWEVNLGTNYAIERVVLHNRTGCCGSRLRDITVRILSADGTATNFTSAVLNPENVLGGGTLDGPANLTLDLTNLTGGLVFGGRVRVTRTPDPDLSGTGGQGNADEADVLSLGEVEVFGGMAGSYDEFIQTDLASAMRGINATVLARIVFGIPVEEMPVLDRLTLRMRYDDGFIAYLNGIEIARRNAPAAPVWNSSATAEHPAAAAAQFEDIDVTPFLGLLQEGENVLALHGLNVAASDDDFLLLPELIGNTARIQSEGYFAQPTPGAVNAESYLGLVADTKFSVDRGIVSAPFVVAITTATPGAEIRYTTNGSPPGAVTGVLYTGPITISRTTVLRAIATKPGYRPSDVDTQTYLFLSNVVAQNSASALSAGYPSSWAGTAADYEMDPRITGPNAAKMEASLRSLPVLCLTTTISNLFDAANGIYSFPTSHGVAWERPASMELIDTNGATEFQVDCGLRIQGGYFRQANVTQKHSFRVLFKDEYGPGKLRHNLFDRADAVQEFDTLVLRAGANDGYSWDAAKDTEQFTRDQFGRDLQLDMGSPAPHGLFVHLYLNGLYWGLYNLVERPNEDFSASYLGGEPEEWDANNAGDIKSGDLQAWNAFTSLAQQSSTLANYQRLQGNNPDGTRNPAYPVYLDTVNYIDYMIVNIWGGNWDWPNKNFWFGRDRTTNSTGFKFYTWDFENVIGNNRARSPTNMVAPRSGIESSWVGAPHYYLKNNPEYRIDFADRVHRYFFNEGLLTPAVLTNRYRILADWVEASIIAESARWGDDNLNPPQDQSDWFRERDWILGTYLPVRSDIVLQQFRGAGLYPAIGAPSFSSYGGFVGPGATLTMTQTNPAGTIYFTLDGTDPRQMGGALSSGALPYTGPVSIEGNNFVRARTRVGTEWSALVEASFTTAQYFRDLVITEIMYNPPGTTNLSGEEFEFLELKNTGASTLNLSGLSFTSGITFDFTNGTRLAPGGILLLARNPPVLQTRYPGVTVNGAYSGRLDNAGETLRVNHIIGGQVFAVTYDDGVPWPVAADGHGFSAVPVSLSSGVNSDNGRYWRASASAGGSPGADDPTPNIERVVINEVLTHTSAGMDFIELHNPTAVAVDVGGWFLTDDKGIPMKFRVPGGTSIPAGGYGVFTEADFNPTPGVGTSFTLNAQGDDVYLFSGDAGTNLTGYSHGFEFGAAPGGVTFGRHLISSGEEQFPLQVAPTPGAANSSPSIGPVVMTEIQYHPRPGGDEFIELKNISTGPVDLFDPGTLTNTWRLNGVGFDFPPGVTLPAGSLALIVSTDPAVFRVTHQVPADVPVFGPYAGNLQDSGERLELQRPDPRGTNGYAYVTVDEVRYNDRPPWPTAADGSGPSLQKPDASAYGNDPVHWLTATPTPGTAYAAGTPPSIILDPHNVTVVATREAVFTVSAIGPGPLFFQWRHDGAPIADATNSILVLTNLQVAQSGAYTAVVFNDAGTAESAPATLTVLAPANLTQQPQDVMVRVRPDPQAAPATNASFHVLATSTSPITYQWLFNGTPIPGATDTTLTITNVQVSDGGTYSVAVTDAAGTIFSAAAHLYPLVSPTVLQPPLSQTVVTGALVTVSAMASGSPLPFSFEWRRGSVVATNITVDSTMGFYTLQAPLTVVTQLYRVVVRNLANQTIAANASFYITTVVDTDGDGLPDFWENEHQLSSANPNDRATDTDGDGMTSWEEYIAGTDSTDPRSQMRAVVSTAPSPVTLSFSASSNRTYTVEYRDEVGLTPWSKLADLVARPVDHVEELTDPAGNTNRFYRLVTPRQP